MAHKKLERLLFDFFTKGSDNTCLSTIVKYVPPIEVAYHAINHLLFENVPTTFCKTGEKWPVGFDLADEYEFKTTAPIAAVITKYFPDFTRAKFFSSIIRLEELEECFKIVPTGDVTLLPNQKPERTLIESGANLVMINSLSSENASKAVDNHIILLRRLMSLKEYSPELLGNFPISVEYLVHNKIPKSSRQE
ncbi:hypothetical protein KY308_01860 [Candidatus Woesearchaeota archaeon]|nr:hypothetical protein [Candidatus Woesearchaeota archaeon]